MVECRMAELSDQLEYASENFEGGDFRNGRLSRREFLACRFDACDFSEADISFSRFEDCSFSGCNLSNASIAGSRFVHAEFVQCKLVGLDFVKCDQLLFDPSFVSCRLMNCNFSGLKMKRVAMKSCDIYECFFQETALGLADFSRSRFRGTLFDKCDLQKASFFRAEGYQIDPRTNDVRKAVFSVPDVLGLLGSFGIVLKDDD